MELEQLQAFLLQEFPQSSVVIQALAENTAVRFGKRSMNATCALGGTVSGPVLMTVADVAMYVAFAQQDWHRALAVTANLTISLRKPAADRAIIEFAPAQSWSFSPLVKSLCIRVSTKLSRM